MARKVTNTGPLFQKIILLYISDNYSNCTIIGTYRTKVAYHALRYECKVSYYP